MMRSTTVFPSIERKYTKGGILNRYAKTGFWKDPTGPTFIRNNRNSVVIGEKRQLDFDDVKPPHAKKKKRKNELDNARVQIKWMSKS